MPPIVVRNIIDITLIDITLIDITLLPCPNTARLERVIAGEGGHGVDNVATVDSCFFVSFPTRLFSNALPFYSCTDKQLEESSWSRRTRRFRRIRPIDAAVDARFGQ